MPWSVTPVTFHFECQTMSSKRTLSARKKARSAKKMSSLTNKKEESPRVGKVSGMCLEPKDTLGSLQMDDQPVTKRKSVWFLDVNEDDNGENSSFEFSKG